MSCAEPRRSVVRIPADLSEVPRVSAALQAMSTTAGLSAELAFQIEVAVVEAVNNAILHGCGDPARGVVEVTIEIRGEDLVVEVAAEGPEFSPPLGSATEDGGPTMPPTTSPPAESGRGWAIMRAWMDEVALERIGSRNLVRLRKRLASEKEAATPR